MTDLEKKYWEQGYNDGRRSMRNERFIIPFVRHLLTGLSIIMAVIFGLLTLGFLVVAFDAPIIGIVFTILFGLLCGACTGSAYYFLS